MDTPLPTSSGIEATAAGSTTDYEVNICMWRYRRYGWGRSLMVSITEAERIRAERLREIRIRADETRKSRSEAAARPKVAEARIRLNTGL